MHPFIINVIASGSFFFMFKSRENTNSTWHALQTGQALLKSGVLVIYLYKHMRARTFTETHTLFLWSFENGSDKSLKAQRLATKELRLREGLVGGSVGGSGVGSR